MGAGIRQRPIEDPVTQVAIAIWNAMGGEIHWAGFETMLAVHGVSDVDAEHVIRGVIAIRDHQREQAEME